MSRSIAPLAVAVFVLVVFTVAGCTAPYVNVPHQTGDVASDDPNTHTVRDVEAKALKAVMESGTVAAPVLIQLPPRTDTLTYVAVADAVGDEVLIPSDTRGEKGIEPASTLTVEQVRVRVWEAEVDVLRPASENVRQRVTVYLKREPFTGWYVHRQHVWRMRVAPAEPVVEEGDAQAGG